MIELYNIKFTGKTSMFNNKTFKNIRFSCGDRITKTQKYCTYKDQTTIQWSQILKIKAEFNQVINFQIYNPHQFGYKPEQLSSLYFGLLVLNQQDSEGKCNVFIKDNEENKKIGTLTLSYRTENKLLQSTKRVSATQSQQNKIQLQVLIKNLARVPKKGYIILDNGVEQIKSQTIKQKQSEFLYFVQAKQKFIKEAVKNFVVVAFHEDVTNDCLGEGAIDLMKKQEIKMGWLLNDDDTKVGGIYFAMPQNLVQYQRSIKTPYQKIIQYQQAYNKTDSRVQDKRSGTNQKSIKMKTQQSAKQSVKNLTYEKVQNQILDKIAQESQQRNIKNIQSKQYKKKQKLPFITRITRYHHGIDKNKNKQKQKQLVNNPTSSVPNNDSGIRNKVVKNILLSNNLKKDGINNNVNNESTSKNNLNSKNDILNSYSSNKKVNSSTASQKRNVDNIKAVKNEKNSYFKYLATKLVQDTLKPTVQSSRNLKLQSIQKINAYNSDYKLDSNRKSDNIKNSTKTMKSSAEKDPNPSLKNTLKSSNLSKSGSKNKQLKQPKQLSKSPQKPNSKSKPKLKFNYSDKLEKLSCAYLPDEKGYLLRKSKDKNNATFRSKKSVDSYATNKSKVSNISRASNKSRVSNNSKISKRANSKDKSYYNNLQNDLIKKPKDKQIQKTKNNTQYYSKSHSRFQSKIKLEQNEQNKPNGNQNGLESSRKSRTSRISSVPNLKRSVIHPNSNIVISQQKRFKYGQEKTGPVIPLKLQKSLDFKEKSSGAYYKGASIGVGSKYDITKQVKNQLPGVGAYKIPNIFDRY